MATKTISLEMDAYEKLRRAKRRPSESFYSVVRRAQFPEGSITAGELLERLQAQMRADGSRVPEEVLDALDAAQLDPRVSDSAWA
ncbi:MAG: hypothetical protein FJX72_13415 [Armatimonadetes bacterium]|nr:hypothetical protein [Armatimonadota bacterium]